MKRHRAALAAAMALVGGQYHRYRFRCHRRDAQGDYHLT